jgi:hypothetical protein
MFAELDKTSVVAAKDIEAKTLYAKNEADSIPSHVLKRIKEEIDASR